MVGLIKNIKVSDNEEDPMAEHKPYMHIISRKDWNAHPPTKEMEELLIPIENIRFTHTGTEECSTLDECKKVLRKIQYEHIEVFNHADIRHNFMIGGGGWVYEGRGWRTQPDIPPAYGELTGKCLEIAYIGNFDEEKPPAPLVHAAFEMIIFAVRTKILPHYFTGLHLV